MSGRTEDADATAGVLDYGKDEQPRSSQGARFDEVGSEEDVRLAAQKTGPGEAVTVGRGLDAVGLEDLPDSGRRDRDSQDGEFAMDSPVTPMGVFAPGAGRVLECSRRWDVGRVVWGERSSRGGGAESPGANAGRCRERQSEGAVAALVGESCGAGRQETPVRAG